MATPEKAAAIAELTEKFRSSGAAVLTEYRGLSVAQITTLRSSMREHATYAVVKNTLTKRAAAEAGIEGLDEHLQGPTAIAFGTGIALPVYQLTLLDAPSLWYRAFHGIPSSVVAPDGSPIGAVRGPVARWRRAPKPMPRLGTRRSCRLTEETVVRQPPSARWTSAGSGSPSRRASASPPGTSRRRRPPCCGTPTTP